jgi:NAD(P)-dependent dehydrogenase (short-subunit alcohol dehydrogenase family)
MDKPKYRSALIVGTGPGLSASLARLFAKNGLAVAVAARQTDKLADLARETGAAVHKCNAADPKDVAALFDAVEAKGGAPDVVVYNASARVRGALVDLPPDDVRRAIEVSAFGAFLVSQQAAKRMLP